MNSPMHVPDYIERTVPLPPPANTSLFERFSRFIEVVQKKLGMPTPDREDLQTQESEENFRKRARSCTTQCDTALWELQKFSYSLKQGDISTQEHRALLNRYMQTQFVYCAEVLRSLLHDIELRRAPEIFHIFQIEAATLSQSMSIYLEHEEAEIVTTYLSQLKHLCESVAHCSR